MARDNYSQNKKIAFPRIGSYNYPVKYFIEEGLNQKYILQPQMTRKTMSLGTKYAPDAVCTPFKTTLGSEIEALEAGADTLIMTMGLCRLGYYGELQEQILRDLGYRFDMVNFAEYTTGKSRDYLKVLKRLNPKYNKVKAGLAFKDALKMVEYIDKVEAEYYKNCGFETKKGSYKKALDAFYHDLEHSHKKADIDEAYEKVKASFKSIKIKKDDIPLRVGVIGEYFTVMDPFSNLDIEQTFADLGVEVHRWMNLSNRNIHYSGEKNMNVRIHDLDRFEMGPTSTANIWCARDYAERGFDGIVHVKSAGCTPEIDVMSVLQNISQDYKIPILYITYDSQTSDTGLQTRIEAFYDMIAMHKKIMSDKSY
ncbi:MAG: hypothetical protein U0K57_06790 [Lachnospiraceae bacterium]|nr:hypothetical protein [Lachnospiraceae bacterium]